MIITGGYWNGTYKMANLRGFNDSTGKRKKQIMKHTAAPRLQAMNMSIRSHRLTSEDNVDQYA
jgi:predicted esterase YcpF (UPF0227 family)